ncbi:MAG TPA: alginate lyase family protein [Vicinamibacteria bacterium]
MQTLGWYVRRVRGMSAQEILWRTRSELRDAADHLRARTGRSIGPAAAVTAGVPLAPGFRVTGVLPGAWAEAPAGSREASWSLRLRSRADAIAAHRLSFFSLDDVDLGDPIAWNREHEAGRPMPMTFAPGIDYRDHRETGDAKVAWEPSRHHQLVVLARAYRATGDVRYARAAVDQLDSWISSCPFPFGMQWRSPLELAIRIINWVFAIDLVSEAGLLKDGLKDRVLHAAHRHLWEVERKYSQGSSANNHLIGEAAGVFVGASYFSGLPEATRWREEAREILLREIEAQTYPEGGNRELALGYHVFALQFFLVAGLVARRTGHDFPAAYWSQVERMCAFLMAMGEGGELPLYGDADDGYVLDLGEPRGDWRGMLAVGAALFGRADMKAVAGGWSEAAEWLLGPEDRVRFDALPSAETRLVSRAFPSSGHYLLQSGAGADRMSVLFDCGELGFGAIAAHGHADALSFTLRLGGHDVLVDPGTYDYFTHPDWRRYFRSSVSHNTLVVDDRDQSEMQGLFLWGRRAVARCIAFEPGEGGGRVVGEHDGYTRLPDPVVHRRTLELDARARTLTVRDEIAARGPHEIAVFWHFSEDCRLSEGPAFEVAVAGRVIVVEIDPRLAPSVLRGSEQPIGGWVSRGYHRKAEAPTLVGRAHVTGPATFVTRIGFSPS